MPKPARQFLFVSVLTIIVSFCSIVYELLYSQALTVLYGETVARYSITIGLYLFSLGIGAFLYNKILPKNNPIYFWWNELALSLIGPLGVVLLFFLSYFSLSTGLISRSAALWISHIPVIAVGVLSGFELPLLVGMLEGDEKDRFSKVLGLDYVGSFLGTLVYSLALYPHLGLIATAFWVGFLNFVATFLYTVWKVKDNKIAKYLTLIFLLFFILLIAQSDKIQTGVQNLYRSEEIKEIFDQKARVRQTEVSSVKIHETLRTAYQQATLYEVFYENGGQDYCLNLDSNVQLCDSWIDFYHAGLVDVPMMFLNQPGVRVLVLGGGDWIGIHYLLKYANVASIDHVDIDGQFIEFMKTNPHFSQFHQGAYKDPKVRTTVDDAFNFLRFNREKYDLVIVDIPGITHDKLSHLYSVEFYSFIHSSLTDRGLAVIWDYHAAGVFRKHYETFMNTLKTAGFRYHVVYDTFDFMSQGRRSSQPFYLLSSKEMRKPDFELQGLPESVKNRGQWFNDLSWIEIPYHKKVRPNTVLRPNYDIVVH
jgi:spermidine synthase